MYKRKNGCLLHCLTCSSDAQQCWHCDKCSACRSISEICLDPGMLCTCVRMQAASPFFARTNALRSDEINCMCSTLNVFERMGAQTVAAQIHVHCALCTVHTDLYSHAASSHCTLNFHLATYVPMSSGTEVTNRSSTHRRCSERTLTYPSVALQLASDSMATVLTMKPRNLF